MRSKINLVDRGEGVDEEVGILYSRLDSGGCGKSGYRVGWLRGHKGSRGWIQVGQFWQKSG